MKPTTRQWLEIASDDLEAAEFMEKSGRYLYAAFQAQQATEKALKAVIQETISFPPKIHDLTALALHAGLKDPHLTDLLGRFSAYLTPAGAGAPSWRISWASVWIRRNRDQLVERRPKDAARCKAYLEPTPLTRAGHRVFPLKGKANHGIWEYEVSGGDRVLYRPDSGFHIVVIVYAGPHA